MDDKALDLISINDLLADYATASTHEKKVDVSMFLMNRYPPCFLEKALSFMQNNNFLKRRLRAKCQLTKKEGLENASSTPE